MQISRAQMDTFREAAEAAFEDRMVSHFSREFPERCAEAGEPALRSAIRLGVERATGYGLTTEAGVCTYITLMFLLGSGFDDDPILPWAAAILGDAASEPEELTVARLRDAALTYLDEAEGEGNELLAAALGRLCHEPLDALFPPLRGDAAAEIVERLSRLHPGKCAVVGGPCLRALVLRGLSAAPTSGLTTARGAGLYAVMMLMLGAHFERDPLIPWAREALLRVRAVPASAQDEQLHRALLAHAGGAAPALEPPRGEEC